MLNLACFPNSSEKMDSFVALLKKHIKGVVSDPARKADVVVVESVRQLEHLQRERDPRVFVVLGVLDQARRPVSANIWYVNMTRRRASRQVWKLVTSVTGT